MKYPLLTTFLFLTIILMAQPEQANTNGPYGAEWTKIDSLIRQGLPQSAYEALNALRDEIEEDLDTDQSRYPHLIKATIAALEIGKQLEENGNWSSIQQLETITAAAGEPQKSIYQSYLAESYYRYWQQNSWQMRNRTEQIGADKTDDPTTWSPNDFLSRVTGLYLASLQNLETRGHDITEIQPLLSTEKKGFDLLPTVYDLLLNRASNYFRHNDAFLNEPKYEPAFDDLPLLAPRSDFIELELPYTEPRTSYQQVLGLYQEALRWSSVNRPGKRAQLDLDLTRLQLVYEHLTQDSKHAAFEAALEHLGTQYRGTDLEAESRAELLKFYYNRGSAYEPTNPEMDHLRWYYQRAIELADDIEKRFPESTAAQDAASIKATIKKSELSLSVEQVQLPRQAGLVLVNFRNLDQVYLRIVSVDPDMTSYEREDEFLQMLLNRKAENSWSEELPNAGDYRSHNTEIMLPALPLGKYFVLASADPSFPAGDSRTTMLELWVSNMALIYETDQEEQEIAIMVLDRTTGTPLNNVTVKLWQYDQRRRGRNGRQKLVLTETARTNAEGRVILEEKQVQSVLVQLENGKDNLFLNQSQYLSVSGRRTHKNQRMMFFTDRGLYRPGQTLYFKALLLSEQDQIPQVVPNEQVEVKLMDVNRQEVATLALTTNQLGSVSGQFTLPESGLLGQMNLFGDLGSSWHAFRVEEYKRPRFEVKLAELADEPALNEEVAVSGSALAYAGPAIGGAEVKYTITRSISFPWFRYGYRSRYIAPREQTIAAGTATTDDKGEFEFTFLAKPDADIDNTTHPLYVFNISTEVVDGTGETRMATKRVLLTAHPFQLQLGVSGSPDRKEGVTLQASCQNLDGQELTKAVRLRVFGRNSPTKTYIDRYWSFPDTITLKERNFRKRLPQYAYAKNELQAHWTEAENVWEDAFELAGTDTLQLATASWPVGHYGAELYVITENGDTLRTETTFTLHDWQAQEFATGQWLYTSETETVLEPGGKAKANLGQSGPAINVWAQWRNMKGQLKQSWQLGNGVLSHLVRETDRGGLLWQGLYVQQNRFYTLNKSWSIPWSNKKLAIQYETFRSQLYPDQEEEWTLRIDGPNQEAATAEVLASMYDASLDQISPYNWWFSPYNSGSSRAYYRQMGFQQLRRHVVVDGSNIYLQLTGKVYPQLIQYYGYGYGGGRNRRGRSAPTEYYADGVPAPMQQESAPSGPLLSSAKINSLPTRDISAVATSTAGLSVEDSSQPPAGPSDTSEDAAGPPPTKVRTNLSETAFFFPHLATDKTGQLVIKFRSPESLTRWKLQVLAHDKELAYALDTKEIVTQKELMVLPNMPRFLREGDEIYLTAKVSNLSDQTLSGTATLELFDINTEANLGEGYQLDTPEQAFALAAEASQTVRWKVQVPKDAVGNIGYRVIARAGNFADGEESALPVLTNRVLLTEAQPLFVRGRSTETFTLERLRNASATDHQGVQLHITSNPAWEAIKALPYLQEYPYDCTEQIVNRLFANTLAGKVVEDYPQTKEVFESWRRSDDALKSPLELNEELKTAALEETPWVRDAQAESLQRQRIAMLFDVDRLATEMAVAQRKLLDRQLPGGGFGWFPEGRENIYMTQYVAEQMSHLRSLTGQRFDANLQDALQRAMAFCDRHYQERYLEWKKDEKQGFPVGPRLVHYLYLRSLSPQFELAREYQEMLTHSWEKVTEKWLDYGLFEQALLGQAAALTGRDATAQMILASLRERSFHTKELGRYWRQNYGFYWYENPIETQAKLIEFFRQMDATPEELAEMKIWLLRNKETNRWETTKATAAAVFALVTSDEDWLDETAPLEVSFPDLGKELYEPQLTAAQATAEAGTGAYQVKWSGGEVRPEMGEVRLRNSSKAPGWGALYWQYFQTIDQVSRDGDNGLRVERQLYRKVNEGEGDRLLPLAEGPTPGDRITVRLTIRADRDLEFVHLKDLRASGLESIQQLSQYRYQGGLGYYQQSTDLGTHFFFDYLRKGEYVLEYDLRVFHAGDFSGGLSTIQCMYAPKFTSHSEGVRLQVQN